MNLVITRGIAINVIIENDSGKPRINCLRIVHLFEADLNFFLQLQWGGPPFGLPHHQVSPSP
jgi:hypothetical protein